MKWQCIDDGTRVLLGPRTRCNGTGCKVSEGSRTVSDRHDRPAVVPWPRMDDTPEERGRKRKKKEKTGQPSPPSFAPRRTFHPTFEFDWSKSSRIKSPEITGKLCNSPGMKEFVLGGNTELVLARRRCDFVAVWIGFGEHTHENGGTQRANQRTLLAPSSPSLLVLNEDVQVQGKERGV